ncbi:hypothetical protein EJB05_56019 [Eragrostis curvula]|uniref:Secreted protein n=1 Tax=Eragrostis curvula TaxID=38414 RepID=A0A5J9SIU7_9POAL|nr:hypothetical protein EJB05_56019 [Eragrostis curvula]
MGLMLFFFCSACSCFGNGSWGVDLGFVVMFASSPPSDLVFAIPGGGGPAPLQCWFAELSTSGSAAHVGPDRELLNMDTQVLQSFMYPYNKLFFMI